MTKKTALLDASSAIILYKAGLHVLLANVFDIVVPESVVHEITGNFLPGAKEFRQLISSKKINSKKQWIAPAPNPDKLQLKKLGTGEHDLILMYYAGLGDFVITDDGAAAKYCIQKQIPFINALLFPVFLKFSAIRSEEYCRQAMDTIIELGRYSPAVIAFALKCTKENISFVFHS